MAAYEIINMGISYLQKSNSTAGFIRWRGYIIHIMLRDFLAEYSVTYSNFSDDKYGYILVTKVKQYSQIEGLHN